MHNYQSPLTDLEIVALDLYFGGAFYASSIATDDIYITFNGLDVTSWARVVSNNFPSFENQVEAYFSFPSDLNNLPFDAITIQGVQFLTNYDL